MNGLRWFTDDETACRCCGANAMDLQFMKRLDEARDFAGVPFQLTSAYRCTKHNKEIGGIEDSRHLRGEAVDIACDHPHTRARIHDGLRYAHLVAVAHGKDFIHVDTYPEHWEGIYEDK